MAVQNNSIFQLPALDTSSTGSKVERVDEDFDNLSRFSTLIHIYTLQKLYNQAQELIGYTITIDKITLFIKSVDLSDILYYNNAAYRLNIKYFNLLMLRLKLKILSSSDAAIENKLTSMLVLHQKCLKKEYPEIAYSRIWYYTDDRFTVWISAKFIALKSLDVYKNNKILCIPNIQLIDNGILDFSDIDIEAVKELESTFECFKGKIGSVARTGEINLGKHNLQNLVSMNCTFYKASASKVDLSGITADNLKEMRSTFRYCKLNKLKMFNTHSVTNFDKTFQSCEIDEIQGEIDITSTTDTSEIFEMSIIHDIKIVGHVDKMNMDRMFIFSTVNDIDFSNLYIDNLVSAKNMFDGCGCLSTLDIRHFHFAPGADTSEMFERCNKLRTVYVNQQGYDIITKNGADSADLSDMKYKLVVVEETV